MLPGHTTHRVEQMDDDDLDPVGPAVKACDSLANNDVIRH